MVRVVIGDLLDHRWVWSAAGLVSTTVAVFTAWCLNFTVTIAATPSGFFAATEASRGDYLTLGSNLLVFSCLPAIVVLAITLSSVTAHTAMSHSLWRLGGASPAQTAGMIVIQAVAVCWLGTLAGVGLSLPFQGMVDDLLIGIGGDDPPQLPTRLSPWTFIGSLAILTLIAVLAVVVPAWRATRRSPIEVRTAPEQTTGPGIGYLIMVLAVSVLVILPLLASIIAIPVVDHPMLAAAVTLPVGQALALLAALVAPWVLPTMIAAWTRIGSGSWTSWQLARHLAVARIASSAATIAPLTLGIGLLATYGMVGSTAANVAPAGAAPNQVEGIIILLPIAVISAVGSIAVVVMAARQHTDDIVTMRSAGATLGDTVRAMCAEAVIVTVSAVLLAAVPVALHFGVLVAALGLHSRPVTDVGIDLVPTAVLVLLTLAGTLIALLLVVRSAWRQPMTALLADR